MSRARRVVGEAAQIYAAQWPLLVITAAIAFVALDFVAGVVWPVFASNSVSATVAALIVLGPSYYYQGMVVSAVATSRRNGAPPGIWRMITGVPAVKLMAIDVLATALVLAGLALAILPGIAALAFTAVVAPVAVVERASLANAFRRSVALVRRSVSFVLLITVSAWLILFAITAGAMLAAGALAGDSVLAHWVGALLASVLVAPITAAIVVSMYFDLASQG